MERWSVRFELSDAEGGEDGGQGREAVAQGQVHTRPVQQVGQARLLPRR